MGKSEKKKYSLIDRAVLATAFNRSIQTINRWIKKDNPILTSDVAREALRTVNNIKP